MKKLLLCFLFFRIGFSSAQTNVYHPFPDSDAVWNINYLTPWACPFNVDLLESYSYVFDGDTFISHSLYHKVNIPFVQANCTGGTHFPGYAGSIRQDTALRQVFFMWKNDTIEMMLYDFTMEVGDTVKGWLVHGCPGILTVSAIDSVQINLSYRKRWKVDDALSLNVAYLVEGIGSLRGLLENICPVIDGPISSLICFQQNGQPLYPNTSSPCNTIVSTLEASAQNPQGILLSPNPFSTTFSLHFRQFQKGKANLSIFNSIGEAVLEKEILLEDQTLDLSALPQGIYLVSIHAGGKIYTQKMVRL